MSNSVQISAHVCVAGVLLFGTARAQITGETDCRQHADQPAREIRVPGFPAERLYVHTKYPGDCIAATDRSCDAKAYVVTGDRITAGQSCGAWTFVEFNGRGRATAGWVAEVRLNRGPQIIASPPDAAVAEAIPPSRHAVCRDAELAINAGRLQTLLDYRLPSALTDPKPAKDLPPGVPADDDSSSMYVSDVSVHGHALKALTYTAGCDSAQEEIWDSTFHRHYPVQWIHDGAPYDSARRRRMVTRMVTLRGETYAALFYESGPIVLLALDRNLHATPLCEIDARPVRTEVLKIAENPELCQAVLANRTTGTPIQEIEPYEVKGNMSHQDLFDDGRIIARGRIDLDNDGMLDDVGILEYSEQSPGHCSTITWLHTPVKLNPDGAPMANGSFNTAAIQHASGDPSRLFMFNRKTYLETRSIPDGMDGSHDVFEMTDHGIEKRCSFLPQQYRARDLTRPAANPSR